MRLAAARAAGAGVRPSPRERRSSIGSPRSQSIDRSRASSARSRSRHGDFADTDDTSRPRSPEGRFISGRAGGAAAPRRRHRGPVADLEEASDGWLPRDPHALLQLVARAAGDAPLSTLHRLIERVRSKESEGRKNQRKDWLAVRGAAPRARTARQPRRALRPARVARARGGTVASGLPPGARAYRRPGFSRPLAAAFVQSAAMPDAEAWRRGVADTFQAIVTREGITPRHAAMRRVKSRFREHVEPLVRSRPQGRP